MRHAVDHARPVVLRAIALVLGVAVLVAIAMSDTVHAALLSVFAAASQVMAEHPVAGAGLFIVLAALSAMMGFFSSTVLIPSAVMVWGTPGTIVLLWCGWLAGGLFAHSIAFYFGRPMLRRFVSPTVLARYERMLDRTPRFSTVVLLQAALPSELTGYLLGLARYPVLRYMAALGLVQVPWAIGTVLLGVSFVQRNTTTLVAISAAGVLFLVIVGRLSLRLRGLPK